LKQRQWRSLCDYCGTGVQTLAHSVRTLYSPARIEFFRQTQHRSGFLLKETVNHLLTFCILEIAARIQDCQFCSTPTWFCTQSKGHSLEKLHRTMEFHVPGHFHMLQSGLSHGIPHRVVRYNQLLVLGAQSSTIHFVLDRTSNSNAIERQQPLQAHFRPEKWMGDRRHDICKTNKRPPHNLKKQKL
jgi:hypothetical protein